MRIGTQLWAIISFVVVVAVVAGGWFLGASPLLEAKAAAEEQLTATEAVNAQNRATLVRLQDAEADLPELRKRALELQTAIPSGLESAALITTLNDLAGAAGVTIASIRLGDGVPYQAPATSESADDESSEDAAADDPATPGAPSPLTDGRITDENFVLVPVSVEVTGPLAGALAFVHGVQTAERLILVTKLSTRTDGSEGYTVVISGTMYVLVREASMQIGDVLAETDQDAEDEPSPSPTPTGSGMPTPNPSGSATPTPTPTP